MKKITLIMLALAFAGCAHRGDVKPVAAAEPAPAAAAPEKSPEPVIEHYIVEKGDCLWTIAAKPTVLGDPFHWPLLYKQNRDEIVDPDIIEPKQDLSYYNHYDQKDLDWAQKQAYESAPYVPHSQPIGEQKIKD